MQTHCLPPPRARNAPNAEFISSRNCRICFGRSKCTDALAQTSPPMPRPGRCHRGCATSLRCPNSLRAAALAPYHDACRPCAGATGLMDEYIATFHIMPSCDVHVPISTTFKRVCQIVGLLFQKSLIKSTSSSVHCRCSLARFKTPGGASEADTLLVRADDVLANILKERRRRSCS